MNILKVDMVAFLMRTFEDYMDNASQVSMFKSNVDNLVKRNQIYPEVRDIIYQIYGIVNTDVFKPTICQEKVYKINMYLSKSKMLGLNPNSEDLDKFKQSIDNDLKMGFINKQIKDILYNVFDFGEVVPKKEKSKKVSNKYVKPKVETSKGIGRVVSACDPASSIRAC